VISLVTEHPVDALTIVIVATPAETPDTAPVEAFAIAIVVSLELHIKVPVVADVRTTNDPTQTDVGPVIADGAGLTPISFVCIQPPVLA
jgi:hypothetical protein